MDSFKLMKAVFSYSVTKDGTRMGMFVRNAIAAVFLVLDRQTPNARGVNLDSYDKELIAILVLP